MNFIKPIQTITTAGILAGTLDGLAAVLLYTIPSGRDPLNVFRFIASGVFGSEAFAGGVPMAIAGIVFHYSIATGWAMLYFVSYPRLSWLRTNTLFSGTAYGLFVWLMMNRVVVPLSNTPPMAVTVKGAITGIVVLMLCVGLPIAHLVKRHYAKVL
jgi:hypothetical protein